MKTRLSIIACCILCVSCETPSTNETAFQPIQRHIIFSEKTSSKINDLYSKASAASEAEFSGEIDIYQLTEQLESIFTEYKDSVFFKRVDINAINKKQHLKDINTAIEFAKDTMWLNESYQAMYKMGLASTTYGMIQTNKYNRVLKEKIVEKYYRMYLKLLHGVKRDSVIKAHSLWLKKMDYQQRQALKKAKDDDGTMRLVTWSEEVDKMYLTKARCYYNKIQKTYFLEGI